MSRPRFFAPIPFLALALAVPSAAQESPWQLRAGATWLDADATLAGRIFDLGSVSARTSGALGLSLGLEYRVSPRLGVELGVQTAEPDVDPDPIDAVIQIFPPPPILVIEPTSLRVTPVTLGLNVHLSPDKPVDVYFAPLLAWVGYGDLRLTGGFQLIDGDQIIGPITTNLGVGDDFTFGARIGADVRVGDRPWAVSGAVTWIDTRIGVQNVPVPVPSVDYDPIFFSLGVGYRF